MLLLNKLYLKGVSILATKIISICNHKGGVGKTTLSYNIGALLAQRGYKVLLCDLDSQASLTTLANIDISPNNIGKLFLNEMEGTDYEISHSIIKLTLNGLVDSLYLIPSNINLTTVERKLTTYPKSYSMLKSIFKKLDASFDFVILDCSPSIGNITINALESSSYLLVPCKLDALSYFGLENLFEIVENVQKHNKELSILGVVATEHENTSDSKSILKYLKKNYDVIGTINRSTYIRKANYDGIPFVFKKYSRAYDIKLEFESIVDNILKKVGENNG